MNRGTVEYFGRWTTPQRLHGALGSLCLGALLLSLVAYTGVVQHRYAVQTVGRDAVPSIIAAQSMKASLADLDANVANELMVKPGQNFQSIAGYVQRRTEVGNSLIRAGVRALYDTCFPRGDGALKNCQGGRIHVHRGVMAGTGSRLRCQHR